jgi:hypothetical protein
MDYFAHGLWSYIFFHRIKKVKYAVLFGLLPDSLSWLIYLIYNVINNGLRFGHPVLERIPNWVFFLYGISHSLIVFAAVALLLLLILKRIPVYVFAWPIAIIIDVFTHKADFLPTPFLWPLSSYAFNGISWGSSTFFIINYSLVILAILYIRMRKFKK